MNITKTGGYDRRRRRIHDDAIADLKTIIRGLFRLPQAEYTIVGLKGLLELNREAVKAVFLQMDDHTIRKFISRNGYVLGLEEEDGKPASRRWLSMWEETM